VIRARRLEERRLERPLRPYWHWLGLVVPFLNLFLLIDGYNLICSGVRRAGVVPPVPFGVSGAFMLLMGVLWKLPGAWWLLSFFSAVVFAAMHVSLDHAERMRGLDPRLARLTAWEIVIVVLGGSLLVLGVLGTCLDEPLRTWIAVGTGVLVILAFGVVFFRIGARRYAGDGRSVRD
jgi:hypothetical protein